jgi:putative acetyltransferase
VPFGITPPFRAPEEAFMALELRPGALEEVRGIVMYPALFLTV